jgi:FKBP-type peptidyl-prolyl cis-trans isomerase SlyD
MLKMKIQKESFVSIDYTLTLESGEVVDKSAPESPLEFVCGFNQIIPGLEKELMGRESNGESFQVMVSPEEAYGERSDELVQKIPRDQFPEDAELKTGMSFQATSPQGMPVNFMVSGLEEGTVEVDLNHPLAGKPLTFDVAINSVREATKEEIEAVNAPACNPDNPSECGGGCSCG